MKSKIFVVLFLLIVSLSSVMAWGSETDILDDEFIILRDVFDNTSLLWYNDSGVVRTIEDRAVSVFNDLWGDSVIGRHLDFTKSNSRIELGVGARSLTDGCLAFGYNSVCDGIVGVALGSLTLNNATNSIVIGNAARSNPSAPNSVLIKAGSGGVAEMMGINDLSLYSDNGQIGIGTLNPQTDITIVGEIQIDNVADIDNTVLILGGHDIIRTDEINEDVWDLTRDIIFGKGNKYEIPVFNNKDQITTYRGFTNDNTDFNIPQDLTVEGYVELEDNLYVESILTVNEDINVYEDLIVGADTTLSGKLDVNGELEANDEAFFWDISYFYEDVNMFLDLNVENNVFVLDTINTSNLIVTNNAEFEDIISSSIETNDLDVVGDLSIDNDVYANSDLYVAGESEFGDQVTINSQISIEESVYASSFIKTDNWFYGDNLNVTGSSNKIGELYGVFICDNGTATIQSRNITFLTDRGCSQ